MSYGYAADYSTPARSQYWRSTGQYAAARSHTPAAAPRSPVERPNFQQTMAWGHYDRNRSAGALATPTSQYAPSPYASGQGSYRPAVSQASAVSYHTAAYSDPWTTSRNSPSSGYSRGRDTTPRSYVAPQVEVEESTPRTERKLYYDASPARPAAAYRGPMASATVQAAADVARSPSPARRNTGRSPSMVKDPCMTFLPAAHPNHSHRLCLALDLDETLVYARNGPVVVRPFARDLLRALHDMDVEVIVWTAGERDYAQSVIRSLDSLGTIQHCVYRHPKWWTGQPGYTKNLRALGRNVNRTLLVDNTPDCLRDQPDNGLLVSDFEGSHGYDDCLRSLLAVVTDLVERPHESVPRILSDCRDVVRRIVPMDAGGSVSVWTLYNDRVVAQADYQASRYNRDSPQRNRSVARRW